MELQSGGTRLSRAQVVPLSAPPSSYTVAVERYLVGAGLATSSARKYRISLTTWGWLLAGERAPIGPPAGERSRPSSRSLRWTTQRCRRCWPR